MRATSAIDPQLLKQFSRRTKLDVWEAAKTLAVDHHANDAALRFLLHQLRSAPRPLQRCAAAYALGYTDGRAIPALERALKNRKESPEVRGQCAESLAGLCSNRSILLLVRSLEDESAAVRFWAAFALGVAGTLSRRKCRVALPALRALLNDRRKVRGLWRVSDEAAWAIANLEGRADDANRIERQLMPDRPTIRDSLNSLLT